MSKALTVRSNWLAASNPAVPALAQPAQPKVSSGFTGHWNLSRLLRPLNYQEFAGITQKFYASVSEAFGTACDIHITSSSRPPVTVSIYDPDLQDNLDAHNSVHVLRDIPSVIEYIKTRKALPSSSLPVVTGQGKNTLPAISSEEIRMKELWDNSGYLKVSIKPLDDTLAPQSAWGVVEFKGHFPKHASFYVQPYTDQNSCAERVATDMRAWAKSFLYSEQYKTHTSDVTAGFAEAKFGF